MKSYRPKKDYADGYTDKIIRSAGNQLPDFEKVKIKHHLIDRECKCCKSIYGNHFIDLKIKDANL